MQRLCPECEKRFDADVLVCPEDGEYTFEVPDDLATLLVGTTLDGRWHIEETLGEGGMGAVFRGRQENLDRPVAIKVLRTEVSGSDKIVARFMREARVLSRLNNPHVVTIFDFGRDSETGLLYLVMELLDGQPLGDWWTSQETPTIDQALMIVEQIAKGLDEAHAQDIIHRDLKPDNIFVSPVAGGVHVKVLDFGIAKVNDENQAITHTGDIHGTPYYMAPEQIDGKTILPATDLYAIGCILHEMFTGKPPFVADSVMAILMHHCTREIEPLEENWALAQSPTREIIALVSELLAKDPEARIENTRALLDHVGKLRDPNRAMTPVAATRKEASNEERAGSDGEHVDTLDFPDEQGRASIDEGIVPTAFQDTLGATEEKVTRLRPEPKPTAEVPDPQVSEPIAASSDTLDAQLLDEPEPFAPSRTQKGKITIALAIVAAVLGMIFLIASDEKRKPTEKEIEAPETASATTPTQQTSPALPEVEKSTLEEPALENARETSAKIEQTSPEVLPATTPGVEPPEATTPSVAKTTPKETTTAVTKTARKPKDSPRKTKETTPPEEPPKVEEKPPEEKKEPEEKKDKTEIKVRVPPLKNDLSDELQRLGNGR